MFVRSSPMTSVPTIPRLSCGRPNSDRVCPVSPSKAVIATSTGDPSVISRPSPFTSVVAFEPSTSRGALISIVGVAPTRPETTTRSKSGRVVDCALTPAPFSSRAAGAGRNAHQATAAHTPMTTSAMRRRTSTDTRDEPRERSPIAAARCEEPFVRRLLEESGLREAELMRES